MGFVSAVPEFLLTLLGMLCFPSYEEVSDSFGEVSAYVCFELCFLALLLLVSQTRPAETTPAPDTKYYEVGLFWE